MRVRVFAGAAFAYGILPYLAWLAADRLWGGGQLVGAYLLASPLIAFAVVFFLVGPEFAQGDPANRSVVNPALQERIDEIAERIGVRPPKAYLQPDDGIEMPRVIGAFEGSMLIFLRYWRFMDNDERTHYLAYELARLAQARYSPWSRLLVHTLFFCGYMIATQNLWWILLLHSGGAVIAVYAGNLHSWKVQTHADRVALEISGRLDIARELAARYHCAMFSWSSLEERLDLLERHAREMGIA